MGSYTVFGPMHVCNALLIYGLGCDAVTNKGGPKVAENKQPTGTFVAQNVTIERTISWPMADVNARDAEINLPIGQDTRS